MITLDETDLAIMRATQAGLPLTPQPYQHIAEQLGLTAEDSHEAYGRNAGTRHYSSHRRSAQSL